MNPHARSPTRSYNDMNSFHNPDQAHSNQGDGSR